MSYTPPTYVDTKAQAILALASVVADTDKTALGDGSVNKALDVLADVLADSDVQVPQTNAGAILALAQYASGMVKPEGTITITENGTGIDVAQYAAADVSVSGGGSTVELTIYEVYNDQPLSTAYFTAEDSSGNQLTVTPHTNEDGSWFTVEAVAGNIVVLNNIENSGYNFDYQSSGYMLDDGITGPILSASDDEIKFAVVSSAEFPAQFFVLMLTSGAD